MSPATGLMAVAELFRSQDISGAIPDLHVCGVSRDSRTVQSGEVFVAQGLDHERAAHVAQAQQRGAALIVVPIGDVAPASTPTLWTVDPRFCFARACSAWNGTDHLTFPVVATTGTKGKTTVTHWAWACLGQGAARVGTVGWHDGVLETPNAQTTPAPEQLHAFLGRLPATCPGAAIEASSHAGHQQRCAGLHFAGLAITNLGRDHLDYHGTVEAYAAAKRELISLLAPGGMLVINRDDAWSEYFAVAGQKVGARIVSIGTNAAAPHQQGEDAWIITVSELIRGSRRDPLPELLPGAFNRWNSAAALALAQAAGIDADVALQRLAVAPCPPGRLECCASAPTTYVDYAHTPESISAVIAAVRARHPGAMLAIVFGCGGDRDHGKRGPMGTAAAGADLVVITTDNSRSEAPSAIAQAIRAGIPTGTRVIEQPDRGDAICLARTAVGRSGTVVVAGKGHETTQNIGGELRQWDDGAFIRALGVSHSSEHSNINMVQP